MTRRAICFIIGATLGVTRLMWGDAPAIDTAPITTTSPAADTAPAVPDATTWSTSAPATTASSITAAVANAQANEATPATTQTADGSTTAPTTRSVATSTTAPGSSTAPTTQLTAATQPVATTQPTVEADQQEAPASSSAREPQPSAQLGSLRAKAMPRTYSVLTQRSIFEKGRFITDAGPGSSQTGGRDYRQARDRVRETTVVSAVANSPADMLIFNGVSQTTSQIFAFIEDTGSNSISLVQSGDLLAGGKVIGVGFDTLDLNIDGKTRHIQIGQTLSGKDVAVATTQPTLSTEGGTGTSGASGATIGAPAAQADLDPLLERMRKRRQAELGGK